MKNKKVLFTVISGLMTFSLLAGCGTKSPTPAADATATPKATAAATKAPEKTAEKVTLTLMANQDWVNKPMTQKAWKMYEEKTGNKLDIQAVPIDSWEKVMKTKFATGEMTDIVMYYGGYQLSAIQPDKNFVDMSAEPWAADLKDFVLPQVKVNNKVYGFPLWEGSVSGMLYNKDIFQKYNIAVPKTQEEFLAACETLKKNGITPIYMAFKDIWPLLPQFGFDPVLKKTPDLLDKLNSNQTKFADVKELNSLVAWYKMLADKGYLGTKFSTNTWDGQPAALTSEKYAMVYAWDTYLESDMEPKAKGSSSKFGLMPMFLGVNEEGTYEGPNAISTYVNKNSKNVEQAKAFIQFMAKPENLNEIYKDQPTQTYFKSVTSNKPTPQYTAAKESVDKLINASVQQNIIGYSQVEMVKPLQDLMLGGKTAEQAIKAMDDERIKAAKAQKIPGF
ncbi:extracellular solute-binding protein [Paenibacillus sp. LMG 31458]|uniref:Extracellular solute-binding protein n=1 Tax=Paenibacillus phytorum TaxID=2654977 RepID=A0ABX1Y9X4_9BACL|nr:ABC transporter substrate-binding protein [Paenibacillus phytorum]NOU77031.1 extracellular solute-binding protein [Paenibacillus phytorum]